MCKRSDLMAVALLPHRWGVKADGETNFEDKRHASGYDSSEGIAYYECHDCGESFDYLEDALKHPDEPELDPTTGYLTNGYDYRNQAWVKDGKYVRCNHPVKGEWVPALQEFATEDCGCYGRVHEGEACLTSGKGE